MHTAGNLGHRQSIITAYYQEIVRHIPQYFYALRKIPTCFFYTGNVFYFPCQADDSISFDIPGSSARHIVQ